MAYFYDGLEHHDSFRVLNLLPSDDISADLQLTLETTSLGAHPHYEAVSYTWADQNGCSDLCETVSCADESQIRVTANCVAILRRLRTKTHARVLWVDAICINQQSDKERSHQVSLMRSIYCQATSVIICLGAASTELLPDEKTPVSDVFQTHLDRMANGSEHSLYEDLKLEVAAFVRHGTLSPLVQGFLDVTGRPWWDRIWVIQEAVSAKNAVVICGDMVSPYNNFVHLFSRLNEDYTRDGGLTWSALNGFKSHLMAGTTLIEHGKRGDIRGALRVVLARSRRLEATDARDRIYGLYGVLANMGLEGSLPLPDYGVDVSSLYRDVSMRLFASLGPGYVLSQVARIDGDVSLPSWCVDWSKRPQHHVPSRHYFYRASLDSKAVYSFSVDAKILYIKGLFVDTVSEVPKADGSAYKFPYDSSKAVHGYRQSCLVGMSLKKRQPLVDVEAVLWRTMCWDVDVYFQRPATSELESHFSEFCRIVTSNDPVDKKEQDLLTHAAPFNAIAVHAMPLCVTESGRLGSVPPTAEVGDRIALIAGSQTPIVLRQRTSGGYVLVGTCFMHHLMDGDAFPLEEDLLTDIAIH